MGFSVSELRAIGRAIQVEEDASENAGWARTTIENARATVRQRLARMARPAPGTPARITPEVPSPRVDIPATAPEAIPVQFAPIAAPPVPVPVDAKPANGDAPGGICPILESSLLLDQADEALARQDFAHAVSLGKQAIEIAPSYGRARLTLGLIGVERGDASALADLFAAAELDPGSAGRACRVAREFLHAHPSTEGVEATLRGVIEIEGQLEDANEERHREPGLLEAFLPLNFERRQESAIRAILASEPDILAATIVRRRANSWTKAPALVIALRLRKGWNGATPEEEDASTKRIAEVMRRIGDYGTTCVVWPTHALERFIAWRMKRTNGARLYYRAA